MVSFAIYPGTYYNMRLLTPPIPASRSFRSFITNSLSPDSYNLQALVSTLTTFPASVTVPFTGAAKPPAVTT